MSLDLYAFAGEQLSWLRSGEVSAADLLEAYIQRSDRVDPALNAIVARDIERARKTAHEIDARRARGEPLGPLAGLPMTVKDSYDVDGLPAICGDPAYVGRASATADAVIVQRLKAAGAIIWGKTNTPLQAGDVQTYNQVYGVTHNPYNLAHTPGGSSGGAAAALAAGLTPLEIGSDIGGSLRTPAHNCGICSLKPTYGLVPLHGHVPPAPGYDGPEVDLNVAGPMARTVADLECLLDVIAPGAPSVRRPETLADCRLAFWDKEPAYALGQEVAGALDAVRQASAAAGARLSSGGPKIDARRLIDVYQRLLIPIITADFPSETLASFRAGRESALGAVVSGEMSLATTMIAATQSPQDAAEAAAQREAFKKACEVFFADHDALIAPVTPVPAIAHNNEVSFYDRAIDVDGQEVAYTVLFQWIALATACHLPSAVVPVARSADGRPIGVQIIGREGSDRTILAIAKLVEREMGGFTPPPLMELTQ